MATTIKQTLTAKLFPHPENPRYILDESFERLKRSLEQFPDMMEKRPLIINSDFQVLGGNMRLKAAIALGWEKLPTIMVDWPIEKQREFIIKDNASFGNWNFDTLANEWNDTELKEWGLEVFIPDDVDLDDFFEKDVNKAKEPKYTITLDFGTETLLEKVLEKLNESTTSHEKTIIELLGIE